MKQTTWTAAPVESTAAYEYLILDIETADAPDDEVRAWFERNYSPPSNYRDPEKIRAHRDEAFAKAQQRAALLPTSPIVAIGLKSESELRCLHCMTEHDPAVRQLDGGRALVEGFGSTRAMLEALNLLFAHRVEPETVIAGFNIRDFDLPAIRRALARLRMPIPAALLIPEQPLFDCMHRFCRLFSGTNDVMISTADASAALGITPHGITGAVVPQLVEAKEYDAVIDKCLVDALEEEQQLWRMTGRA